MEPKLKPKTRLPKTKERLIERLIAQDLLTPLSEYYQILYNLNVKHNLGLTNHELDEFRAMLKLCEDSHSEAFVGVDICFGKTPQDDWELAIKCLFSAAEDYLGFQGGVSIFKADAIKLSPHLPYEKKINLIDLNLLVGSLHALISMEVGYNWANIATIWWLIFNIKICDKLGLDVVDGVATGIAIPGVVVLEYYIPYVFSNGKTLYLTMVDPNDNIQLVLSPANTTNN